MQVAQARITTRDDWRTGGPKSASNALQGRVRRSLAYQIEPLALLRRSFEPGLPWFDPRANFPVRKPGYECGCAAAVREAGSLRSITNGGFIGISSEGRQGSWLEGSEAAFTFQVGRPIGPSVT